MPRLIIDARRCTRIQELDRFYQSLIVGAHVCPVQAIWISQEMFDNINYFRTQKEGLPPVWYFKRIPVEVVALA